MAYVPGFDCDLFISYAQADNVDGWVHALRSELVKQLKQRLGYPFCEKTVYMDKTGLRVGHDFMRELRAKASDSAVLVVLLSPSYAASPNCRIEIDAFQEKLPPGATLHDCLAAVKLRDASLPEYLSLAHCTDFSRAECSPLPFGTDDWHAAIEILAKGIETMLKTLRTKAGAVFVGSSIHSDHLLRARLADFIAAESFRAVPDHEALLDGPKECVAALQNTVCAVHFIGGMTELAQHAVEASIVHCKQIVLFKPYGARVSKSEENFLSEICNSSSTDVQRIDDKEMELQYSLKEVLTKAKKATIISPAALALICDRADFDWARGFQTDGLSSSYPQFLDEVITRTEEWRRWVAIVTNSNGLLFYNGNSDEYTLSKVWELALEKRSNAEREWYLAEPDLQRKLLRHPRARVYPDGLDDFLSRVRRNVENRR